MLGRIPAISLTLPAWLHLEGTYCIFFIITHTHVHNCTCTVCEQACTFCVSLSGSWNILSAVITLLKFFDIIATLNGN